jgi:hypothetical protein
MKMSMMMKKEGVAEAVDIIDSLAEIQIILMMKMIVEIMMMTGDGKGKEESQVMMIITKDIEEMKREILDLIRTRVLVSAQTRIFRVPDMPIRMVKAVVGDLQFPTLICSLINILKQEDMETLELQILMCLLIIFRWAAPTSPEWDS